MAAVATDIMWSRALLLSKHFVSYLVNEHLWNGSFSIIRFNRTVVWSVSAKRDLPVHLYFIAYVSTRRKSKLLIRKQWTALWWYNFHKYHYDIIILHMYFIQTRYLFYLFCLFDLVLRMLSCVDVDFFFMLSLSHSPSLAPGPIVIIYCYGMYVKHVFGAGIVNACLFSVVVRLENCRGVIKRVCHIVFNWINIFDLSLSRTHKIPAMLV